MCNNMYVVFYSIYSVYMTIFPLKYSTNIFEEFWSVVFAKGVFAEFSPENNLIDDLCVGTHRFIDDIEEN